MTLLTSVVDLMTTKTTVIQICWYLFLYLMEVIKHKASNSQLFELKSDIFY